MLYILLVWINSNSLSYVPIFAYKEFYCPASTLCSYLSLPSSNPCHCFSSAFQQNVENKCWKGIYLACTWCQWENFQFLTIKYDVSWRFYICSLSNWENSHLFLVAENFYHKRVLSFNKCFMCILLCSTYFAVIIYNYNVCIINYNIH